MKLKTREVAIFGMLGALMYASKVFMELLPNVHLLGVFTISFTLVYRKKALYPIYTYVLLNGLFAGFATWWIPYLYLWTILWGVTMLLPQKIPKKIQPIVYMIVNACHGFLFGTLYAPAQAILFGLSFKGMIAWIIAGLPWDFVHGVSNFFCGILIVPIVTLLRKLENKWDEKRIELLWIFSETKSGSCLKTQLSAFRFYSLSLAIGRVKINSVPTPLY